MTVGLFRPGEGIIEQMSAGLKACKFFFFFVSKASLQSNMVKLEWQNALYKSTNSEVKIIPVKMDDCMMPEILLQTLYIDAFGQGIEVAKRQIIDVISGDNTYRPEHGFQNIRAYIKKNEKGLIVEFRAEAYMEPHSKYIIRINNKQNEFEVKVIGESIFEQGFQEQLALSDGSTSAAIIVGKASATSPGFLLLLN